MDWFKHWNTETEDNNGLQMLIAEGDFETAFVYWWLCEQISKFEKPEDRGRATLNFALFKRKLNFNSQKTSRILDKIGRLFDIEVKVNLDQTVELFDRNWLKTQENRGGKRKPKLPQTIVKTPQKKEIKKQIKEPRKPPQLHPLAVMWNQTITKLSKVKETTDKRNQKAQKVWELWAPEKWQEALNRVEASDFCNGINDRSWTASFDWILQDDVYLKIMEGKYDNREKRSLKKSGFVGQRTFDDLGDHRGFTSSNDEPVGADHGGTPKK